VIRDIFLLDTAGSSARFEGHRKPRRSSCAPRVGDAGQRCIAAGLAAGASVPRQPVCASIELGCSLFSSFSAFVAFD